VHVGRARIKPPALARRQAAVLPGLAAGGDVDLDIRRGLGRRLLAPVAGDDVIGAIVIAGEVHRDLREMLGGAALQEQHGVVVRDRGEFAQVGLGLFGHRDETLAAMGLLHHRGATAVPVQQLALCLLKHRLRQRRRPRTEIPDPHRSPLRCMYRTGIMRPCTQTMRMRRAISKADQQHQRDAERKHGGGGDQPPHFAARPGRLFRQRIDFGR
jgi:hypothetical protein